MMTIEEIRDRLRDHNLRAVARRLDVPYVTLQAVMSGRTQNPGYRLYTALVRYIEGQEGRE